jgi:lipopolysaccharide export system permease protein
MSLLNKYISKTISSSFFPIFFSLFAITSVIFLVKIATLTSIITINFIELLYLYALSVPQILFYTLPISFFVAMIINFAKLSNDYELVVLTSFGQSPQALIKRIIPLSLLFCIALFIISFILMPQSFFLNKAFMNKKNQEAQFNIRPSEYGQSFGLWFIYVQNEVKDTYYDVTLFQPTQNEDIFIKATSAKLINDTKTLQFNLFDGNTHIIGDNFKQIEYKKMVLTNQLEQIKQLNTINDIIKYWENMKQDKILRRDFIKNIQISLLPIVSVVFYLAFGYYNPRYEKNRATLYGIGLAVIYIILASNIAETYKIEYSVFLPFIWFLTSVIVYVKKVKPYY